MQRVVSIRPLFRSWKIAASQLLMEGTQPSDVVFEEEGGQLQLAALLDDSAGHASRHARVLPAEKLIESAAHDRRRSLNSKVPKTLLDSCAAASRHDDPDRWHLMYRLLFRITHGEPSLLEAATDPDVHRLNAMNKAVRHEVHRMHAFVRFREVAGAAGNADRRQFVAWFEPLYDVVEAASKLFVRRFRTMHWSILTPRTCVHWNCERLEVTAGVSRRDAPSADALEEMWRTYYSHIFNPARLAPSTMRSEMPVRYWINLPESSIIASLTKDAPHRVARMLSQVSMNPANIPEELREQERVAHARARMDGDANSHLDAVAYASARVKQHEDPLSFASWCDVHDPGVKAAQGRMAEARALMLDRRGKYDPNSVADVTELNGTPIRIGTASWTDPTLLESRAFYPDEADDAESRLRFYASRFPLVEVDSTFYVMPSRANAAAWARRTPDNFVFDIKAFALMTGHKAHVKRLPDWLRRKLPRTAAANVHVSARDLTSELGDQVWSRFIADLQPLHSAGKLGPILLQYPRWFAPSAASADELRIARERLGNMRAAVEFRNPEWVSGRIASRTFALLEKLQLTYVIVDAPPGTRSSMPPTTRITTPDLSVVRLHGRRTSAWESSHRFVSERYRYLYDRSELSEWAKRLSCIASRLSDSPESSAGSISNTSTSFPDIAKAKQGVHVVFNNCHANYGTTNADEITALLIEFDRERKSAEAS